MADIVKYFDIYNCLLSHDVVSATYISNKLGMSIRNVYRYIEALDPVLPIQVIRGKGGGFKLMDSYTVSKNCFTEKEFKMLISVLDGIPDTNKDIIDNIKNKLFSTQKEKYESYSIKSDYLLIDGNAWGNPNGFNEKITLIGKAVSENKNLFIKYSDRKGEIQERHVEPHILILKDGIWYVYAYCNLRKDFRLFKVSRIRSLSVENTLFERKAIDKKKLPFEKWFESIKSVNIDFTLTDRIKPEVEEWLGVENVIETAEGKITANAKLPDDNDVYFKILSFGNDLTVTSPKHVKTKLREIATTLAEKYK